MTPLRILLLAAAVVLCSTAPVEQSLQDKIDEEEDMLLLLVPSVPMGENNVQVSEDQIEYDLIAIPGDVLRREIRQTGHNYGILEETLQESLNKEHKAAQSDVPQSTPIFDTTTDGNRLLDSHDRLGDLTGVKESNHDKRSFLQNTNDDSGEGFLIGDFKSSTSSSSTTSSSSSSSNQIDPKEALRNVGQVLQAGTTLVQGVERVVNKFSGQGGGSTGGLGGLPNIKGIIRSKLNLAGGGGSQNNLLGNVGQVFALGSTVVGGISKLIGKLGNTDNQNTGLGGLGGLGDLGGNIVSSLNSLKQGGGGAGGIGGVASGIQSFSDAATGGLRYVGRLSTSLLRILLQIPGIKARVFTEIVQAGTPLKTAVSDVIGENANDMRQLIEAGTSIIRDAFDIIIRLVTDVLALKGRMLASLGANGLDTGSSLFDGGLRIGGAVVQTAGDVASALGRGVGEVVQVVSEADIPPLPQLPSLPLPNLGALFNAGGGNGNGKSLFGRRRR